MSTTGGSTWSVLDDEMDDGYALAVGSIYQGGTWDHDNNYSNYNVPAVFKTTNNGASWNRYYLTEDRGYVYSILVHPANANTVYAGGYYDDGVNWRAGLWKSTDGGSHWSDITGTISSGTVRDICIDPTDYDDLFLGHSSGIYRSTNGGNSWTKAPAVNAYVYDIIIDPADPDRLFAGSSSGCFISCDGGDSWSPMNDGMESQEIHCLCYDHVNGYLYAGTYGGGVFRNHIGTAVEPDVPVPQALALYQNFPNPFNAGTSIRYVLNRTEQVSLKIYDTRGRLIATLADEEKNPGLHMAEWNGRDQAGRDIPSGIYMMTLFTESGKITRKLILQK